MAITGLPCSTSAWAGNPRRRRVHRHRDRATLLWAASTRQLVKFPYVVGVGTMVVAGCVAAVFGKYPHEGALALLIDLFLLAWATTVANVGRTDAAAGFLVRVWCVTGSLWSVGLLAFVGHHAPHPVPRPPRRPGRASPSASRTAPASTSP